MCLTLGRVASGAVAEKWLKEKLGIEIVAWVSSVGDIEASNIDSETITRQQVRITTAPAIRSTYEGYLL